MYFWIPVGILEKIGNLCFIFLWSIRKDHKGLSWIEWKALALPKKYGGWGLKILVLFARALTTKSVWKLIQCTDLWVHIVVQKYIHPM